MLTDGVMGSWKTGDIGCRSCAIVRGEVEARVFFRYDISLANLDHR
jgi:hypothetical protein